MRIRRGLAIQLALLATLVAIPAHAEYLDLERALNRAMEVSTRVGISREQLKTARSDVLGAYGGWMPNLNLSAYGGHSFAGPSSSVRVDAQGRAIAPAGFDYEAYTFNLSSNLTFFNFGTTTNRVGQAKRTADAAGFDLKWEQDVVTALVIREFYDLVKQRRLVDVQQDDLEAKTRNLEQVEAFYKIGSRTKADFLQARVDLANSELELLNRQNAEELAEVRLKNRLRMPVDTSVEVDESLDISQRDVDLAQEAQYMMMHRSDLLAGQQRTEAARNGILVASRSRWPSLSGTFSYGWNDREFPEDGNVFRKDYVWSLGLFLNWDIFDRFQSKTALQNAKARHRIAEYNLEQSKLDAVLDLQQIGLNLQQASERMELAAETVANAEENMRLAQERYRVGAGTILETIAANASLTSAQAQLIDARVDYLINIADLQRATGRPISTR